MARVSVNSAQVQNEDVWAVAWADIIKGGMTPQAAADKAFKKVEPNFIKYPIAQPEAPKERTDEDVDSPESINQAALKTWDAYYDFFKGVQKKAP